MFIGLPRLNVRGGQDGKGDERNVEGKNQG